MTDITALDDLDGQPHANVFPDAEPKTVRLSLEAGETVPEHTHPGRDIVLYVVDGEIELVDEPGAVLAYEQREGIFDTMTTRYELDAGASTTLTATTDFALDVALVGEILDSTVIKRQRQKELAAQFGYLADAVADS